MAVAVTVRHTGIGPRDYNRLMQALDLDADIAIGQISHFATATETAVEVFEVWMTAETAHRFVEQRLVPALRELKLPDEPEIAIVPLHNAWVAEPDALLRIGAVSLPATDAGAVL